MSSAPLPRLETDSPWTSLPMSWSPTIAVLHLRRDDGVTVTIELERCVAGRLENAYPVSLHDVEVRFTEPSAPNVVTSALGAVTTAFVSADTACRRVVFAAPCGDATLVNAAEQAGFRYVVEVDLPNRELSLLVYEPEWVKRVDMDLDRVPGS